jgi:hypothetical protein
VASDAASIDLRVHLEWAYVVPYKKLLKISLWSKLYLASEKISIRKKHTDIKTYVALCSINGIADFYFLIKRAPLSK